MTRTEFVVSVEIDREKGIAVIYTISSGEPAAARFEIKEAFPLYADGREQ